MNIVHRQKVNKPVKEARRYTLSALVGKNTGQDPRKTTHDATNLRTFRKLKEPLKRISLSKIQRDKPTKLAKTMVPFSNEKLLLRN